jgi:uncharacterized protein YhjY with autotransporter beta-barrel domain
MSASKLARQWLRGMSAAALLLVALPAAAQTLDEQYEFYLADDCENMDFARVPGTEPGVATQLAPGQAAANLATFCRELFVGTGVGTTTPLGGAGFPNGGDDSGADTAARRRREAQGADGASSDIELASFGNATMFFNLDYRREDQQATRFEGGRLSRELAGTLGFDYRFRASGVAGVALGIGDISGDIDAGGRFDGRSFSLLGFGSWWLGKQAFVDVALGYGENYLNVQRLVFREYLFEEIGQPPELIRDPADALAFSKPRQHALRGELAAGYDFTPGGWSIGPRLRATLDRSTLTGYAETGQTPMTLNFTGRRINSLQSLAGLQVGRAIPTSSFVLVPQLNADWAHEFRADQPLLQASFAEDLRPDPSRLRFLGNAPDRDWYVIRASLGAVFIHGFSGFLAVEATAGHAYIERYRASLGLRIEM